MLLNLGKTKSMLLKNQRGKKAYGREDQLDIKIDNKSVTHVKSERLLGITIDEKLSWEMQLNNVKKSVCHKIAILRRIKRFLPPHIRQTFYQYYIQPILEYCCIIWSQPSKKSQTVLIKLQKQAARVILDQNVRGSNSEEMFNKLGWLPFNYRVDYHLAVFSFKALNGMLPTNISSLFKPCKESTSYSLRSGTNNNFFKTRSHPQSIVNKAIAIWNNLPQDIKTSPNFPNYKKQLKCHLHSRNQTH